MIILGLWSDCSFRHQETGNWAGSVHSSPASCHADASEISHHSDEAHDKTDIAPQESIFETFGKHRPCGRIRDAPRFPMTFGSPILLRGGPEMQHRHHATSLPYLRPVAHWRLAVGELHNLKQEHLETLRNSSDDDNASEIKTFPSSETVSEIATLKCRKKQLQGVPNFFRPIIKMTHAHIEPAKLDTWIILKPASFQTCIWAICKARLIERTRVPLVWSQLFYICGTSQAFSISPACRWGVVIQMALQCTLLQDGLSIKPFDPHPKAPSAVWLKTMSRITSMPWRWSSPDMVRNLQKCVSNEYIYSSYRYII